MASSHQAALQTLMAQAGPQHDLLLDSTAGMVRINLKPEDLRLWRETAAEHQDGGNLLLACESGAGDLSDTRLSWVVGAAIRCTQIPSTAEAATLLEQMGCEPIQVAMLAEQCPGLGSDQTWAIYLDRHGWLTASPVPKEQDTISALEQA